MRKIFLAMIIIGISFFPMKQIDAQAKIGIQINIGSQPVWGPVGYDAVQYYYLPDIEAYYCVQQHVFCYYEGGRWVKRTELPPRYAGFDLYHAYKVVLNEKDPWRNHTAIRAKYVSFKGRHDQQVIRDSHDSKYFVIKDHPQHGKVVNQPKREVPPAKVRNQVKQTEKKEAREGRDSRENKEQRERER
jgi:hypothetical protein